MIPVNIHGMATDEDQENYVVILNGKDRSSDKWLPIQISATEAQNIAIQLNDMEPERPLSHDLLATITEELDGTIEKVRLDTEDTRQLHGTVEVSRKDSGESLTFDAAPSDAIALALRTDAEIVVEEAIMQTQDPTQPDGMRNSHPSDEVTRLRDQLDEAVENEEFEEAAELKDEIRDAIRRYEESVEDLGEDLDDELRDAYEGSGDDSTGDSGNEQPEEVTDESD